MLIPDNRVVMISGANRGIGLAIAQQLSKAGYRLSLGVRNPKQVDPASFANEVIVVHWDAIEAATCDEWAAQTLAHYGCIDALVMNAGVIKPVGFESGSEADLDLMWEVNFKAPWRLTKATLPALRESGRGRVVNLVSLSGKRLMGADNLGYSASKFASTALTHAIRQAGWESGIRATAICPGLVDTDMVADVETPDGQFKITPEAIAATAGYVLSLPNEACVAEILVNSRLEHMF